MSQLTVRQQAILTAIRQAMETRGYPPSMRELGEAVGLTSSSSVRHQLDSLQAKGFIERDPERARAIRILDPQEALHG